MLGSQYLWWFQPSVTLYHVVYGLLFTASLEDIKRNAIAFPLLSSKTEKEGFEPSRRLPDLHP